MPSAVLHILLQTTRSIRNKELLGCIRDVWQTHCWTQKSKLQGGVAPDTTHTTAIDAKTRGFLFCHDRALQVQDMKDIHSCYSPSLKAKCHRNKGGT